MINFETLLTKELIPDAVEHPGSPTVMLMLNIETTNLKDERSMVAIMQVVESLCRQTARGLGVLVLDAMAVEIWRADYGDLLSTRRCVVCGRRVGPAVSSSLINEGEPGAPSLMIMCCQTCTIEVKHKILEEQN